MPELHLWGCRTQPVLAYLKTLGVFRHAARKEPATRLAWRRDGHAVLHGDWDPRRIVDYFLDEYEPSPITSPWNGGSGYYAGDRTEWITVIECSRSPRFRALRDAIGTARTLLGTRPHAPDKDTKGPFLEEWRATCPEDALSWLDAAIVLGDRGAAMNPVLGTGGNDGRFEFSNNFLARLCECLSHALSGDGRDTSERRLEAALLDEDAPLMRAPVGMFAPGTAGLPNSSSTPASETFLVNPWDFVLGLEGTLFFAGGPARRLDAQRAVFPFSVRATARVGTNVDADSDRNVRGEAWLPIWRRPATIASVSRLFSEGRLQDSRSQASENRDAVRAIAALGVDRGVAAFERIMYAERFGRNYVAVPVGRLAVRGVRSMELVRAGDWWIDRARRISTGPVAASLARVDRALLDLATAADESIALERWLLALAEAQLAVARNPGARATGGQEYVPPLSGLPTRLARSLPDTAAHRLASVLAAGGRHQGGVAFRSLHEPVRPVGGHRFTWSSDRPPLDASPRRPAELLVRYARVADPSGTPDDMRAGVADVAALLTGTVRSIDVVHLAYALSLCEPRRQHARDERPPALDRLYAVASLVTAGEPVRRPEGEPQPVQRAPEVIAALGAGNARTAARAAHRRLTADGLAPFASLLELDRPPEAARVIAAALAFPVRSRDRAVLEALTLRPVSPAAAVIATASEGGAA